MKLTHPLVCITIHRDVHKDVKIYAARHGMKVYEVMDKAFRALEREEKQNNKK